MLTACMAPACGVVCRTHQRRVGVTEVGYLAQPGKVGWNVADLHQRIGEAVVAARPTIWVALRRHLTSSCMEVGIAHQITAEAEAQHQNHRYQDDPCEARELQVISLLGSQAPTHALVSRQIGASACRMLEQQQQQQQQRREEREGGSTIVGGLGDDGA